uniref:Erythrocyte membrane protein 1 n=1 Tax=Plasmodium gaboni TaxID=647221 RepID=A0A0N9BHC8_9APIC|nr:erythrocyte membrane protein 1 [Plasmodium gaboni]
MKQIYNILSFLLIFNVYTFLKNVECNGHINENDTKNIKNGLPDNNLEIENVLNIRGSTFDKLKNDLGESSNEDKKGENKIYNEGYTFLHGKEINDNHGMVMNFSKNDKEIPFSGSSSEDENNTEYDPQKVCKNVGSFDHCPRKDFDSRYDWHGGFVKNVSGNNKGVLMPPRRRKLCLLDIKYGNRRIKNKEKLRNELLKASSGESQSLFKFFQIKDSNSFVSIKYSFADIADIVKGTDMMDSQTSKYIKSIFDKENEINPEDWWKNNRESIWEAMMCGQNGKKKDENFPAHDNIDEIPQFFRWFREWATMFCNEYETEMHYLSSVCIPKKNTNPTDSSSDESSRETKCDNAIKNYEKWFNTRRPEWIDQSTKYNRDKSTYEHAKELSPEDYLKKQCPECLCTKSKITDLFDKVFDKEKLLKLLEERASSQQTTSVTSVETARAESPNTTVNEGQHVEENAHQGTATPPISAPSTSDNSSHLPSIKDLQVPATNNDPYERILGWEFGNVNVPGTNPYISSKESDSLELINLTSWDKEDIIKQNEDVKDEIEEQQQEKQEDEEGSESDLNEVAETNEEDQDEILEEDEEDEEEEEEEVDEDEVEENIEEEKEKKDRENTESEKQEKEVKESEKHTEKGKEGKKGSARDADEHQILSVNYKNNNDLRKGAETIVKKLFSLFNENNNLETMFKDLTKDMTSLFQQ